jgi:AcrR family transcriptional regulator
MKPRRPSSEIRGIRVPTERPGAPGGKRDQNRAEKVTALQAAALPLMLERGIEGTTIDDITRAAGVPKGSYYRYFEDKTALVEALLAPVKNALDAAFVASAQRLEEAPSREALEGAYAALAMELGGVIFGHLDVVRLYLQEARSPAVGARVPVRAVVDLVARHALDLTVRARAHGLLNVVNPQVSSLAVVGAVERLLFAVLVGDAQGDPLEMAGQLIALVLDGVRAR